MSMNKTWQENVWSGFAASTPRLRVRGSGAATGCEAWCFVVHISAARSQRQHGPVTNYVGFAGTPPRWQTRVWWSRSLRSARQRSPSDVCSSRI